MLGQEIYAAIFVGVWDAKMLGPEIFLQIFTKSSPPPPCSILNDCFLRDFWVDHRSSLDSQQGHIIKKNPDTKQITIMRQ